MSKAINHIQFMGIDSQLANRAGVLEAIKEASSAHPISIATLNPEFILDAQRNQRFRESLNHMSYATIDGFGLLLMMRIWNWLAQKQWTLELYHGSDMVTDLFRQYQNGKKSFFFLGGPPGLVQKAKETALTKFPGLVVVGEDDGGRIPATPTTLAPELISKIEKAKPDILLVGFGSPKQEIWVNLARQTLSVPVIIGVGGSLGFYSVKKRAPKAFRALHLEWFYRALTEKGHWKRSWRAVVIFSLQALVWMGKSLASRGNETK